MFRRMLKQSFFHTIETNECTLNFEHNEKLFIILHLETKPEFRNQGFASETLRKFIEYVKEYGGNIIKLTVHPLDSDTCCKRLKEFYKKFGFKETASLDMYLEL